MSYTEGSLIQQTTADCLAQHLGWESAHAYNGENSWADSLLDRKQSWEISV